MTKKWTFFFNKSKKNCPSDWRVGGTFSGWTWECISRWGKRLEFPWNLRGSRPACPRSLGATPPPPSTPTPTKLTDAPFFSNSNSIWLIQCFLLFSLLFDLIFDFFFIISSGIDSASVSGTALIHQHLNDRENGKKV